MIDIKVWYKEDKESQTVWINKEYVIQLNLTGSCPFVCDFCYIKNKFSGVNLDPSRVLTLWNNLRKYSKKLGIFYRVNMTGGDLFFYPKWREVAKFLLKEKSVRFVDPLLNKFWKPEEKDLLSILSKKITYVQFNLDVVTDNDIKSVGEIGAKAVVKISIYRGKFKIDLLKAKKLVKKFPEILYVSADLIIPQKHQSKQVNKLCIIDDFRKIKSRITILKKGLRKNFWVRHPILAYLAHHRRYFCPVPFSGTYVFPDGSISICPRYPHLKSGFIIENFDLIKYVSKFQKLISTTCLFNNKYFSNFFPEEENPSIFLV